MPVIEVKAVWTDTDGKIQEQSISSIAYSPLGPELNKKHVAHWLARAVFAADELERQKSSQMEPSC